MTEERLCCVCAIRGRRPVHYERPNVCEQCRVWLAGVLRDIADTYPDLAAALQPRRGGGQRVAGSREAPVPVVVDVVDLTAYSRPASIAVRYRHERLPKFGIDIDWASQGGDPDQIGHLPIATELEFWVTDWTLMRGQGEHLPPPEVTDLTNWLRVRLDWAMDDHPAIDEFATALMGLHGAMRAYVPRVVEQGEQPPSRPERRTAPCPECNMASLWWMPVDERVRCVLCPRTMTEAEYRRWAGMIGAHAKRWDTTDPCCPFCAQPYDHVDLEDIEASSTANLLRFQPCTHTLRWPINGQRVT